MNNYEIISDYCIGAVGKVKTVVLFSQVPLNQITKIYLDTHSRTSVNLVKVLAREYWKINPEWEQWDETQTNSLPVSAVMIGDKTFAMVQQYRYTYDLAEEWQDFTNLPFVFACWVANKP